jgi:hypothetical protein
MGGPVGRPGKLLPISNGLIPDFGTDVLKEPPDQETSFLGGECTSPVKIESYEWAGDYVEASPVLQCIQTVREEAFIDHPIDVPYSHARNHGGFRWSQKLLNCARHFDLP